MKLDSFKLKIFAIILMVLDHLGNGIANTPIFFNQLGRIVAPIFFFLIVEGFFYTLDRKKYMIRLFFWSFIMYMGTNFITYLFPTEYGLHNNIFLSLAMAVALMNMIEWTKNNKKSSLSHFVGILGIILISILSLFTEASLYGLLMTLVFYLARDKKILLSLGFILISLMDFTLSASAGFNYFNLFKVNFQWMMVFSLPFILMYNGQRGLNNKFTKYMFYIFYPVHLWIIYIIGYYLKS